MQVPKETGQLSGQYQPTATYHMTVHRKLNVTKRTSDEGLTGTAHGGLCKECPRQW